MDTKMKLPGTALEQDLEKWQTKQNGYINRYSTAVMNDRDFMKAKRDVLKGIFDRHKNTRLGMDDKIELAILKGQIKQMNERIQPNRFIRGAVSLLKFLGRPLEHLGKLLLNVASTFLIGKPIFNHQKKRHTRRTSVNRSAGQSQGGVHREATIPLHQQHAQKTPVLRKINRERILTDMPGHSKGVTR